MAKLGSYFGLCPLIDHRSLLGISDDQQNGQVVVTLGKNIALQYRLSDQKQILNWTTREKFTSPVVFDFDMNKYVAVFSQMCIRCWDYNDMNLDKVKRIKFKEDIHTLVVIDQKTFVIFQNGSILTLEKAISNHKSLKSERVCVENEHIVDFLSCSADQDKFIALVIGNSTSGTACHLLFRAFDNYGNEYQQFRLKLERKFCHLVGSCLHSSKNQVEILTLWSDGKLYSKSNENNSNTLGEVFSVIESISCKESVAMVSLNKDYLAMYGSDKNQEGAYLIIYNMQFKVTQAKQSFKLLTLGAKLWTIQEKLFLPVGQNLAVVPYYLKKEQLSELVGSHKLPIINNNDKEVLIVSNIEKATWGKSAALQHNRKENLQEISQEYLDQGFTESAILQELTPIYIEKRNLKGIIMLVNTFHDIPEECLAELLKYVLDLQEDLLNSTDSQKEEIVTSILKKEINEVDLIPYLRVKLNLKNVLNLMTIILKLLSEHTSDVQFVSKLIKWLALILDANYQAFLLCKDTNTKHILLSCSELVNNELLHLDDLQKLHSMMKQISKKRKIAKTVQSSYMIEKLDI